MRHYRLKLAPLLMILGMGAIAHAEVVDEVSLVGKDGRRVSLVCLERNYGGCKSEVLRVQDPEGETLFQTSRLPEWDRFSVKLIDRSYSFTWSLTEEPLDRMHACLSYAPSERDPSCTFHQKLSGLTLNRLIRAIVKNFGEGQPPESALSQESCQEYRPRRQVGRGLYLREGSSRLSLVCLAENCDEVQFELQDDQCVRQIGTPFAVDRTSTDSFRESLRAELSRRMQHRDLVDLYRYADPDLQTNKFNVEWRDLSPDYFSDFVDTRAITSLLKREKKYWQLKPREVERDVMLRMIAAWSDRPELHLPVKRSCRVGRMDLHAEGEGLNFLLRSEALSILQGSSLQAALGGEVNRLRPEDQWTEILKTVVQESIEFHLQVELAPWIVVDPTPEYSHKELALVGAWENHESPWTFARGQKYWFYHRLGSADPDGQERSRHFLPQSELEGRRFKRVRLSRHPNSLTEALIQVAEENRCR